jgi:GT2 family glycosyltransferase
VRFLESNRGIAGNTNAALELATGDYVGFLDHDDTLAPFALFEVARALNDWPDADILYSDEDFIDESGLHRFEPTFKPAWSPDVLRGHNYVCHFAVYRRELLNRLGGVRGEFDGAQDHDLILRASECARRIVHIPRVLYHWRRHPGSTAYHIDVKPGAGAAARRAVSEHLERLGIAGRVETNPDGITCAVRLANPHRPLVSVLIPNRDSCDVLETCLKSVVAADYQHLEILIIENNSTDAATFRYYDDAAERDRRIRVLNWPGPFNYAAMHNWAVRQAQGEVLLLLNNDVEARHPDWIERMLEHAVRDEVGAVGAKLYFPDGRIQHGGIVVGIGGIAAHLYRGDPQDFPGDHQRLLVPQNLSALTAACLMLRKEVYRQVGGFDESLAVTFNDVDLCLRIRQLDKLIVWTPYSRLWHHESLTRGSDDTPDKMIRAMREARVFREKWAQFLAEGDPYYNPNLGTDGNIYAPDPHTTRKSRARSSIQPVLQQFEESRRAA